MPTSEVGQGKHRPRTLQRMREDAGAEVNNMLDFHKHVERLADILFNGRKAEEASGSDRKISIQELCSRKVTVVRCGGKIYEVTVHELEMVRKK